MDLRNFKFPEPTNGDYAFSTYGTIPELLQEAEERGFDLEHNPYNQYFSDLFFVGGKVSLRTDIDINYRDRVWVYCKCLMRSWEPKHEHKTAVCAMLMAEVLELPEKYKKS